ncbi:MAG: flavin reductase [Janthinobacterium lividum]
MPDALPADAAPADADRPDPAGARPAPGALPSDRAPLVVGQAAYRDAMARLGAAVNIVTSDGPAGRCGFTASSVCSVTDDPPTLLVCLNRTSANNARFKRNGVLCVNVLAARHEALSAAFAGSLAPDARFAEGRWSTLATGAPVLDGARVAFDCRIDQVTEVGTHSVLFCAVEAIRTGDNEEALIYLGRAYHRLATPA